MMPQGTDEALADSGRALNAGGLAMATAGDGGDKNTHTEPDGHALPGWVMFVSIGWLVILVALVAFSEPCDPPGPLWRPDIRYLSCLQANEIGDFLAGAFAPLAFFWLIATVVIQARELRAQRQELQLTRREFEANRKVAEAQAAEAKRQAEYIGAQTDLLREEQKLHREARADKEYDACVAAIARVSSNMVGEILASDADGNTAQRFLGISGGTPLDVAISGTLALTRLGDLLTKQPDMGLSFVSPFALEMLGLVQEIDELQDEVTPSKRVEMRPLSIELVLEAGDLIIKRQIRAKSGD